VITVVRLRRAIASNPFSILVTVVAITAAVVAVDRVMAHRYQFGLQWGPDRRLDLAPAPLSERR
jgi:hypothetical protein